MLTFLRTLVPFCSRLLSWRPTGGGVLLKCARTGRGSDVSGGGGTFELPPPSLLDLEAAVQIAGNVGNV